MKKRILCLLVLLGLGMQAHAATIGFEPSDQTISEGDSVFVDLVVTDLADDILAGFDLSILFDDTVLSFLGFEFGTFCDGHSCLDLFGLGSSFQDVFDAVNEIIVYEFSFDSDQDLVDFQPNDFVLGTFEFLGLAPGVSPLEILVRDVATTNAEFLDASIGSGSITVMAQNPGPNPVPEPGTLLLLMIGLLGLRMARPQKAIRA